MTLRNNIENTVIPNYSRKQETANAISHFLGLIVAGTILYFGIYYFATDFIKTSDLFGFIVFATSAFLVYLVSGIYHITPSGSFKKKGLRVLDHCMIYLLIAGTYTPICIHLMQYGTTFNLGLFMLLFEWIGAIIGIILNAFFFQNKAARVIAFILYILMGWLAMICCVFLFISVNSFMFILVGGIVYTIGSILYAIGHGNKWFHFVFHIFVLLGTIIQAMGIIMYLY